MLPSDLAGACRPVKLLLFDCDGVLTGGQIVLGNGDLDLKLFSTRDGLGIGLWHRAGYACGVVTARWSEALARRAQELKFEEVHQSTSNKRETVRAIRERRGLRREEVAYVGDDLNDLCVKHEVGLFFAPADAHPAVASRADHHLRTPGGQGAVREAIDLILTAQHRYDDLIATYLD
ncbi:MAG: 3-deoxy-D-manno-octulosonate 8-phosphate phosphatase [Candidatus Ozemobacter sibiricus]|jgi:3-deoxy-D-manno-octulosonate 8-phosphate phosphatase (KDO 8-P phosphatase)|uniref:3-deoxy-D-manno-octulosonate 8-phosphate phosphatase n=1 Tax=Candidatus Ozemobacter sibiricus TaxID=2268124 RepID=A0A367ZT25_9BACT|nr:MAG: 3-deoxy-D-manno-octulosonate 8-phosphate phosphatase [Candidatus Ozemobacter sibiricus]